MCGALLWGVREVGVVCTLLLRQCAHEEADVKMTQQPSEESLSLFMPSFVQNFISPHSFSISAVPCDSERAAVLACYRANPEVRGKDCPLPQSPRQD